jgi:hypothetical protein
MPAATTTPAATPRARPDVSSRSSSASGTPSRSPEGPPPDQRDFLFRRPGEAANAKRGPGAFCHAHFVGQGASDTDPKRSERWLDGSGAARGFIPRPGHRTADGEPADDARPEAGARSSGARAVRDGGPGHERPVITLRAPRTMTSDRRTPISRANRRIGDHVGRDRSERHRAERRQHRDDERPRCHVAPQRQDGAVARRPTTQSSGPGARRHFSAACSPLSSSPSRRTWPPCGACPRTSSARRCRRVRPG